MFSVIVFKLIGLNILSQIFDTKVCRSKCELVSMNHNAQSVNILDNFFCTVKHKDNVEVVSLVHERLKSLYRYGNSVGCSPIIYFCVKAGVASARRAYIRDIHHG